MVCIACPQNWPGVPDERNPLFEHFYRKAGLFLSSKPCGIEAFSFTALTHKRKNSRNAKPIFLRKDAI
jgi:hypothetical protein